jgi:hypothetical protein
VIEEKEERSEGSEYEQKKGREKWEERNIIKGGDIREKKIKI